MACLSAMVALMVHGLFMFAICLHKGFDTIFWNGPLTFINPCGFAVLGIWTASAHTGNLRREPGWIDAMGTMIGISWVILMILEFAYPFYF